MKCGGGVHQRIREIISPPKPGGEPCPILVERKSCGLSRCSKCQRNLILIMDGDGQGPFMI